MVVLYGGSMEDLLNYGGFMDDLYGSMVEMMEEYGRYNFFVR